MKSIKLALLNIKKNIQNEKELKSSFIISVVGMAINNISFLILWYYFGKAIGEVNGWKPIDVCGWDGFGTTAYGIVVSLFSGMARSSGSDEFLEEMFLNGSYDSVITYESSIISLNKTLKQPKIKQSDSH